jgi:hypothetical protein
MSKPMNNKFVVVLVALNIFWTSSLLAEELYSRRSTDMGIEEFDITVTEIKRERRISVLNIPGFHDRSAAASRWMMCVYTDIAIKRGFDYFVVLYPEPPDENLLIGFSSSEAENIVQVLGAPFRGELIFPETPASVDMFAGFCGIEREKQD